MAESDSQPPPVVSASLQDLKDGTVPLESLVDAFGPDSLGIIIVTDLPPEYIDLRRRLLSLSSYFAALPPSQLQNLEVKEANYAVGWSHGKEKLKATYDFSKGSYYAQPIHDAELEAKARKMYPRVPEFTSENVWPSNDVLPGFAETFEKLCRLIVDVAGVVAAEVDRFGRERVEGYPRVEDDGEGETVRGVLERMVRGSVATKGRLLHYFPPPTTNTASTSSAEALNNGHGDGDRAVNDIDEAAAKDGDDDDDWCATHKDLGALTGLTSNMYIDESAHPPFTHPSSPNSPFPDLPELDAHPDPKAGLWILSRAGHKTQVHIPRDALAFQTGEVLEMVTRGAFKAVPHFVRGGRGKGSEGIARNTLAVFTQPNLWEVVDQDGRDFAEVGGLNLRGYT